MKHLAIASEEEQKINFLAVGEFHAYSGIFQTLRLIKKNSELQVCLKIF